ncbi:MAG: peptidoglycan DD-metalloendopeptidase family protein [Desulfovibrionaceae bacterium]
MKKSSAGKGLRGAVVAVLVAALGVMLLYPALSSKLNGSSFQDKAVVAASGTGDAQAAVAPVASVRKTMQGVVRRGDTVSSMLNDHLSASEIHDLSQACGKTYPLSRIRAGQPYAVVLQDGAFTEFAYEIDADTRLVAQKSEDGFCAATEPIEYEVRHELVQGMVSSSLYEAVRDKGEGAELAIELFNIFAWEIDFVRDIRSGDTFKVYFEKRYRDGEFAGYGRILAAEFVNQGEAYQGFRFEDADGRPGFYTADGQNLRKAFLKAPLDFSRISSGYSHSRLHPVLGIRRPHHGVDYAAPIGTPVKASADGVVTRVSRTREAGKFINIRHPNGYVSGYLHLNGYAKGIKSGAKVRQGQVIGYVGKTGLATGPHLDYRIAINGRLVNPASIKNTRAKSLTKDQLARFATTVAQYRGKLETTFAEAATKPNS